MVNDEEDDDDGDYSHDRLLNDGVVVGNYWLLYIC